MKKVTFTFALITIGLVSVAQLITPFTVRYSVSQKGGIVMLANTAAGCGSGTTACGGENCAQAHAELPPNGTAVNNDFINNYADIDNDATTFMSSSDSLNLSACSRITFAGLYWGAGGTTTDPSGTHWALRDTVKLKLNNGTYQSLTADYEYDNTVGYKSYHCFKDITSIVAAGMNGRYTIANIPILNDAGTTKNRWGGWVIVIIYKNDFLPYRNLTVFNGLTNVSSSHPATDLPITGFYTPLNGPVTFEVGVMAYDGDRGWAASGPCSAAYRGDSLKFKSAGGYVALSDSNHPSNDMFNSTISNKGVLTPFRNPNYNNTLGFDANIFAPDNTNNIYLTNNATSAVFRQITGGETYLTQVITTAIDDRGPDLRGSLGVVDLNGGVTAPGDTLEYTMLIKNIGSDTATNVYVVDTLGRNANYVPGSLRIIAGANSGNLSDTTGDDQGEYLTASRSLRIRIGTGANSSSGGKATPLGNDTAVIKYRVTATTDCIYLQCDNIIKNRFWMAGTGQLSGVTHITGSNPTIYINGCPVDGTTNTTIPTTGCTHPAASNVNSGCTGGTIQLLIATSPNANYIWTGPNGFYSAQQNPVIINSTSATAGTYYVTINVLGITCGYSDSTVVAFVNPSPAPPAAFNDTICSGSAASLSATGTGTISWYSAASGGTYLGLGTNFTTPILTADTTFYAQDSTCSASASRTPVLVKVNPLPLIPTISQSLNTLMSNAVYGNQWYLYGTLLSTDTAAVITITPNGNYTVSSSIHGCSSMSLPFSINDNVWPGDANNDSLVNNYDLLPIGLFYGQSGPSRNIQGNVWQADSCFNWGILQSNGFDIKHADCNGDGTIDNNDTLAVNLNFNQVHAIAPPSHNNSERSISPDLFFVTNSNTYNAGDLVDVEIWAGTSTLPISNLYGIAFNINYNANLVQSGTESLIYPSSWLGTPGTNAIKIGKTDALANTAYGAETRINHSNVSGFGKIADFTFQLNTNLTLPYIMNLSVTSYAANDSAGAPIVFNLTNDSIHINSSTVGINPLNKENNGITISPNPFTSETNISFSTEQKNTTIKIMDVVGKEIKTVLFSGKSFIIEKGTMQSGIYFVKITFENKNVVNRKIIVE